VVIVGRQENPAQRLEAGRPPGSQDAGGDKAEAKPAESREWQQVHQGPAARVQDPPERKQKENGGHRRDDQVTPDPELGAEPGTERADGRKVNGEVKEHHGKPGGSGEIPERAGTAVRVGQRQAEREREHRDAADGHGRGAAAGKPGQRRRQNPFASHGEQDPDDRVDGGGDETKAGEHDHEVDNPQRGRRPVPAGEIAQRAGLPGEAEDIVPSRAERLGADDQHVEKAGHDHDADRAGGDGAARVPGLLAERGRGLKAGERGNAVNQRVGDVSELAVRRRRRPQDRSRVVRWPDLDQDADGQRRDHGHLPGDQGQIDPGRCADAQVGDASHGRQDDHEQRSAANGHMQAVGQQLRRVRAGQRDTGGHVQRVRKDHHPAGQELPGRAQPAAVVGVQRAG
jgi:hypothetical protein